MDGPDDQGPTPEQTLHAIFGMVAGLAPAGTPEKQVSEALEYAFAMETLPAFAQMFDALFDPEKVKARGRWGVKIHREAADEFVLLHAPKRLSAGAPDGDVSSFATALGLFTSPVVRAVLALHGFRVEFVEVGVKNPGPRIVRG